MIENLAWSLWIYDIGYYILMLFCLRYAWKQDSHLVVILVSAVVFGYTIEYGAVTGVPQPYHYNFFIVKLPGPVPLGAVIGWGIIFFASTQVAKHSNIPWMIQPLYAGLLAVAIDIVIDPIVVYVGFWTWTEAVQWFGIPWSNYIGWVGIIASLSFFQQLGYRKIPPGSKGLIGNILVAFVAMLPAYLFVFIWIKSYVWLVSQNWLSEMTIVGIFFTCSVVLILHYIPQMKRNNKVQWIILAIPAFFYSWAIVMLYLSGLHNKFPELVLVFPAFIVLGMLGFCLPYINTLLTDNKRNIL
ncbi:MAG: carotenoid biosynthesis protein [Gammaproteobacteria bacterium]|nr:carotenoid biosynthesis protein [Gammaproteobacteria bacterium]